MSEIPDFEQLKEFVLAWLCTQPRIQAMFIAIPIFNTQVIPGMLRYSVGACVGILVAPILQLELPAGGLNGLLATFLLTKEVFIGFVLGYMVAIPFWAFEAFGVLIDNQRGATIASTLNPLTGNDASPLGILFNQAFVVFFLLVGGFHLMLELLYDSYLIWGALAWFPTLEREAVPLYLGQLARVVNVAVVLSAPVVIAMFLAEIGLAFISRFVPQLDVFFLAMPIKSGLAIFVLLVYLAILFEYGLDYVNALRDVAPFLQKHWTPPQ